MRSHWQRAWLIKLWTGGWPRLLPVHLATPLASLVERVRGVAREYGFEELQTNWWLRSSGQERWPHGSRFNHRIQRRRSLPVTSDAFDSVCGSAGEAPF